MSETAITRSANGAPFPSDPDLIEAERAPPWLWPPIIVLAATGCAVVFIVLPLLTGPPSRSEPWQALAWLPLGILALSLGGSVAFLLILLAGVALRRVLLERHAVRPFVDLGEIPMLLAVVIGLSFIPGIVLARTLGWGHPAAVVACALLSLGGVVAVHEALILLGWLHEEAKGCCRRSTVGKPEHLNRIATDATPWSTEPGRSGRAFGGSERSKNELVAALVEQRRRGAVVRDEPTAICDFRIRLGCPVPCQRAHTATDGHPAKDLDDHHRLWRTLHGVPAPLSALEDAVFSNLPPDLSAEWPERFASAIPVGADLAMTADRWLLSLLTDTDSPLAPVDEQLKEPAELLRRRLAGNEPSVDEWRAVPGFSGSWWSEGAIEGIAGAVARAGAAPLDLDAAREVAGAAVRVVSAATRLQAHTMAASRRQARRHAVREAHGLGGRALARTRWLAGTVTSEVVGMQYDQTRGRVWRQMADRLVEVTAAS